MNTPDPVQQPQTSAWSIYRAIVGIGALCALLIVTVYMTTADRIRENQERFLAFAVSQVLPAAQSTIAIVLDENGQLVKTDETPALPVFLGYDANNELVGAIITAQGMGYADNIRVLYAYSFELNAIVGFMILESRETPGLGDKVETEAHFVANFEALDATLTADGDALLNPIVTVKQGAKTEPWQLDGITGATITAEAIGKLLNNSADILVPALERDAAGFTLNQTSEEQ